MTTTPHIVYCCRCKRRRLGYGGVPVVLQVVNRYRKDVDLCRECFARLSPGDVLSVGWHKPTVVEVIEGDPEEDKDDECEPSDVVVIQGPGPGELSVVVIQGEGDAPA